MKITEEIQTMRVRCGWDKTDTPAMLAKSVFVEAGELLECFQDESQPVDWAAVRSEAADVLMYAMALCMDQGCDVEDVIRDKFADVFARYL